ncbi:hypothetical protein [Nocardiopsis sp. NPDC006938]|uniref:hypothetical protein n=1 Tax=Nocardiopsis sp. NPDC006938 TaxID=3364337 RepID=UPI0036C56455
MSDTIRPVVNTPTDLFADPPRYTPGGARAIRALTICWYTVMSVTCSRCNLKYNKADPMDREYHEKPGGCR